MTIGDDLKKKYLIARHVQWQYKLDDYATGTVLRLSRALKQSRLELTRHIKTTGAKVSSKTAERTLKGLNRMTLGVQAHLTSDIEAAAKYAGVQSLKEYGNIMSFNGAVTTGFSFDALSSKQLNAILTEKSLGGKHLKKMVSESFDRHLVANIKEDFLVGALKGEGTGALTRRIRDSYGMIEHEATTLARTHISTVNNKAAAQVYKDSSDVIDKEEWSATLEVSTSTGRGTCMQCVLLDGKQWTLESDHPRPPAHPRCRCFMLPVTKSYKELGLNIPELEDLARPFTKVDGIPIDSGGRRGVLDFGTFKGDALDFVKKQGGVYESSVFGPTRMKLLETGKVSHNDLLKRDGSVKLLKEMPKLPDDVSLTLKTKPARKKIVLPTEPAIKAPLAKADNSPAVVAEKAKIPKAPVLTKAQNRAISEIPKEGKYTDDEWNKLRIQVNKHRNMNVSPKELVILKENLSKDLTIVMNRSMDSAHSKSFIDVLENGKFKNQFELGANATSGGYVGSEKGSARDRWEKTLYKNELHKTASYKQIKPNQYFDPEDAKQRPVYAYALDADRGNSKYLDGHYGDVTFVLKKDVKKRTTLCQGNSSQFYRNDDGSPITPLMNLDTVDSLVETTLMNTGLSDQVIQDMIEGKRKVSGFTRRQYVESQIFGGVDIARDVEKILIPKDYYEHIKLLGEKFDVPVQYK